MSENGNSDRDNLSPMLLAVLEHGRRPHRREMYDNENTGLRLLDKLEHRKGRRCRQTLRYRITGTEPA